MIFKEFTKDLAINGQTITTYITVKVEEDYDTDIEGGFDFGNETENKAYLARFESGELFMGCIVVKAQALGLCGVDVLGACHLYSNNMFDSSKFNQSVEETIESHAMVENALKDLENIIVHQARALAKFA